MGVEDAILPQVAPPSKDRSIFTFPRKPLDSQRSVFFDPRFHFSPPFGESTCSQSSPGGADVKKAAADCETFIVSVQIGFVPLQAPSQ